MQTGFQVSYFKRSFSYGLYRKSFELITPQANKKKNIPLLSQDNLRRSLDPRWDH